MFLPSSTDPSEGQIYRIKPDGSKSVFALFDGASGVTYCNGALYAVSQSGDFFKITATALNTETCGLSP